MPRKDEQQIRCSFCGKRETQVERLIAGPGVYICSDCVSACSELLKDEINLILSTLTDREEKVIRLRFGLEDGRSRTLEEVGKEFNVTRERIRQIEAKALRKLRHPSRSKRLKDFLD